MKGNNIKTSGKPLYRRKKIIIPVAILAFLTALAVFLEPILLDRINKEGEKISSVFYFHVNDLDLSIFKGQVELENMEIDLKETKAEVARIESIHLSIAWREVFRGRLLAAVEVNGMDVRFSQDLVPKLKEFQEELKKIKEEAAKDKDEDEKKESPFRLAVLTVNDSSIRLTDYPRLKPEQSAHVSDLWMKVTNLTPTDDKPLSDFHLKAVLLGAGGIESNGQFNLKAEPLEWSVDGEIQQLDMTSVNDFLLNRVPLSFTKGQLDLYAEARSQKGSIEGYVKPFVKDVDVMETKEVFEGPKHWLIELITAIGNIILRAPDKKSVAARVPFDISGEEVNIDKTQAAGSILKHGFKEKLDRGIEHKFKLE